MDACANVLVVEDDKEASQKLGSILCSAGNRVTIASCAKEGLEILKKEGHSIVIIELQMADMNAGEFVGSVKNIDPKINVIVITPYLFISSAIKVMEAGAFAYITRPFNPSEIRMTVQHAAEHYLLMDEAKKKAYHFDLSILDSLTGAYNHRYLHEVLDREIARANRYPQHFCLVMADIDDFNKYNDLNGHLAGDALLKQVAGLLMKYVRNPDLVFRYGGEEFVILMMETKKREAQGASLRILKSIEEALPVTASMGIADYPGDSAQKDALIKSAAEALSKAKKAGKNQACII